MKTFIAKDSRKSSMQLRQFTLLALVFFGAMSAANAAELALTVSDIRQAKGNLYIRVYAADSDWLSQKPDGPLATEVIDLATLKLNENGAGEITRRFQLPEGTYAATAIHDRNKNGKLDTDWRGVPEEPSGTSASGKKTMGPPEFESSKFELANENVAKVIRLREY